MKRLIPILLAAATWTACEKDPDTDKLDDEYLVVTNYDKEAPFADFHTYYLPDSILLITDKDEAEYWTAEDNDKAAAVLATFRSNMDRLYEEVPLKALANVGLQVSYVASTYYFTSWDAGPWWSGYPGYWDAAYWGGYWGGWYYPYPVTFSYSTGSFIAELVNLDTPASSGNKMEVVWTACISGLLTASGSFDLQKAELGIDQAFAQSPYLKN